MDTVNLSKFLNLEQRFLWDEKSRRAEEFWIISTHHGIDLDEKFKYEKITWVYVCVCVWVLFRATSTTSTQSEDSATVIKLAILWMFVVFVQDNLSTPHDHIGKGNISNNPNILTLGIGERSTTCNITMIRLIIFRSLLRVGDCAAELILFILQSVVDFRCRQESVSTCMKTILIVPAQIITDERE